MSSDERAEFWGDIDRPWRASKQAERMAPIPAEPLETVGDTVSEEAEESPRADAARVEKREQVLPPDEIEVKDHFAPRLPRRITRGRERAPGKQASIALQTPEEYEGEVTWEPTYFKAVLFGLLAGILLALAYAVFEWKLHSGRWILGWVIGFVVGIVVVFASGRHFNLQLGFISAGITWLSLCVGQVIFSMLDVRFNSVFPLKLPFPTLLHQAISELWNMLGSTWLIMFIIAGVVAFAVSFRPWPIKFQVSPPEDEPPSPRPPRPGVRQSM